MPDMVVNLAEYLKEQESAHGACLFFSTPLRKFVAATRPGHRPVTRKLFVDAATADLAMLTINAALGVEPWTRRCGYLLRLIGVRHIVVVVDRMDLTGFSEAAFRKIAEDCQAFTRQIGVNEVIVVPAMLSVGDKVGDCCDGLEWYQGATLNEVLETVGIGESLHVGGAARFQVRSISQSGIEGQIVGGTMRSGDRIRILPSGREGRIASITTANGELPTAAVGQAVTLTLSEASSVSVGDLICAADSPAGVADQFEVTLAWTHEDALLPGRTYLLKIGELMVNATVTEIKYQVNADSLEHVAAKKLVEGAIGICNIGVEGLIPFDAFAENRVTGCFVLLDKSGGHAVGSGMIHFALRRALNVHLQHVDVDKRARSSIKGQRPCVLWLTGLSGSGKSTIANVLERKLLALGRHTYLLDGDNVRHGLNRDLGFTAEDRVENIRRIAEVAKLMVDAGLLVITSFISPFRAERRLARGLLAEGEFLEIFVDTPLAVAEQRDVKGLYKKARRGELKNFTGIDSPYEAPEHAEFVLDTTRLTAEEAADLVIVALSKRGYA